MATGSSHVTIEAGSEAYTQFEQALIAVCQRLAQLLIRDGEGATKFVTIDVTSGKTESECERVAYTVAHSPLVKTALFAADPNWGRILAAVGRAGVEQMDMNAITITLGTTIIVSNGGRAPEYTEAAGQSEMSADEITITIDLGRGNGNATVWSCDFSYDYVKINAEYRT
jgi:glutamate N-acetyltransferase/amino-acid N-acetyltransferase